MFVVVPDQQQHDSPRSLFCFCSHNVTEKYVNDNKSCDNHDSCRVFCDRCFHFHQLEFLQLPCKVDAIIPILQRQKLRSQALRDLLGATLYRSYELCQVFIPKPTEFLVTLSYFLNLHNVDILARKLFLGVVGKRLPCAFQHFWQRPWPLPTRCRRNSSPSCENQNIPRHR